MISVAICDNNPAVIWELTRLLEEEWEPEEYLCAGFETARDFRRAFEKVPHDLVFMDILFGEENGIQVMKELLPRGGRTRVIFVTAYSPEAADLYEAVHDYILRKPLQKEEFRRALALARTRLEEIEDRILVLRTRVGVECIPTETVRYIESVGRKVQVHCLDGCFEAYGALSTVVKDLPDSFAQSHKSYCVNMKYIRKLEPKQMILDDGSVVLISQARRREVREKVSNFLLGRL